MCNGVCSISIQKVYVVAVSLGTQTAVYNSKTKLKKGVPLCKPACLKADVITILTSLSHVSSMPYYADIFNEDSKMPSHAEETKVLMFPFSINFVAQEAILTKGLTLYWNITAVFVRSAEQYSYFPGSDQLC